MNIRKTAAYFLPPGDARDSVLSGQSHLLTAADVDKIRSRLPGARAVYWFDVIRSEDARAKVFRRELESIETPNLSAEERERAIAAHVRSFARRRAREGDQ